VGLVTQVSLEQLKIFSGGEHLWYSVVLVCDGRERFDCRNASLAQNFVALRLLKFATAQAFIIRA
jgi:hypothetical protein